MASRALALFLVLAVALGLSAPAMAQLPVAASSAVTASPMGDDCAKMMPDHQQPKQKPCDGSLKCMLAMGCLSVNLVADLAPAGTAATHLRSTGQYWPAVASLHGTSFAPEPDPPTFSTDLTDR